MSYTGNNGSGSIRSSNDVALSNPANGQVLTYDSSISKWKNTVTGTGTYTKPSTGIPLTDLELSVRTSLGQAATNSNQIANLIDITNGQLTLVIHGTDATVSRPDVNGPVLWMGTVQPNGLLPGDITLADFVGGGNGGIVTLPTDIQGFSISNGNGKIDAVWTASNDGITTTYEVALDTVTPPVTSQTTINNAYTVTGLLNNTTYYVRVRGLDVNGTPGNWTTISSATVTVVPDTTRPTITAFAATGSTDRIILTWNASDNVGVDHYVLTRNGNTLYTGTNISYVETPLSDGNYTYHLVAYDASNNASTLSSVTGTVDSSSTTTPVVMPTALVHWSATMPSAQSPFAGYDPNTCSVQGDRLLVQSIGSSSAPYVSLTLPTSNNDWSDSRPNNKTASATFQVNGPDDWYDCQLTVSYYVPGVSSPKSLQGPNYRVRTGVDATIRMILPSNTDMTNIRSVNATANFHSIPGAFTMSFKDFSTPPSTATYGPAPTGASASMQMSAANSAIPAPDIYDEVVLNRTARLQAVIDWAQAFNTNIVITEVGAPALQSSLTPDLSYVVGASNNTPQATTNYNATKWTQLMDQYLQLADRYSVPLTYFVESESGISSLSPYFSTNAVNGVGSRPFTIDAHKPSAVLYERHFNAVPGRAIGTGFYGELQASTGNNQPYSSSNHGSYQQDYFYPTQGTIDYLVSKGMTLFRIPVRWDRVMRASSGPGLDAVEWGYVRNVVDMVTRHAGCYAIIDSHDGFHYATAAHPLPGQTPYGPGSSVGVSDATNYWLQISNSLAPYRGKVIYELANEPHQPDQSQHTVEIVSQAIINTLRANGDNSHVVVPVFPTDQIAQLPSYHPWIQDPAGSSFHSYVVHHYFNILGTGLYSGAQGDYGKTLAAAAGSNPNFVASGAPRAIGTAGNN